MEPYILGIDIGTGSTKGIAINLSGEVLSTSQHRYPILQPKPGYSEQEPELIWQAFVNCVTDVTTQLKRSPHAVSFSSAMHSLILVDEDGKPQKNMITWADTRSETIAEDIRQSTAGESIYKQTGTPIHPMAPLCKLIWLRKHETNLFNKAVKYISIKEYIWYKLFQKFEIDYSLASATGLFDIVQLQWSDEACQLAGVSVSKLSKAVNTNYMQRQLKAETANLLGVTTDTCFVIGASDGCCANLGSHVTDPGMAALTIGTSGAVRVTGAKPVYNYEAMTFNYRLNESTFVSGGAVNNGGIAVDWLLKNFLNQKELNADSYTELFKAIDTIPAGSEGLMFLPYLYGERAPIWDAHSSGSFLNIKPQHRQAHFLRAALEGICYALNDLVVTLEQASSTEIKQISISGGFITSPTWTQILADITGKKLVAIQKEDASAMGAIYLAIQTLYPDHEMPGAHVYLEVEPDVNKHKRYAKTFPLYKKLYQDLKNSMELLNQVE